MAAGSPVDACTTSQTATATRWAVFVDHPYTRDLVGYGRHPPHPQWPDGARIAVQFVVNYEEGSEYSIADGDSRSETSMSETPGIGVGSGDRDLSTESIYEYGSRVGFWRLHRLFIQRDLPVTIFGCALALERNPDAAAAIREACFDVCCHGWRWIDIYRLSEADEAAYIRQAVGSLERLMGERPVGWFCGRFGPSVNTRRLLVQEGGFLYDSDSYNDELPYWVTIQGKAHLVIPYALDTNDTKFAIAPGFGPGEDFFSYLKDSFDVLYREGESSPRMMSVGLHTRLCGRPGRALALERFLDYLQSHSKVWICRRLDIAKHWMAHHPAPGPSSGPGGRGRAT
jgi:allantoinase